MTITLDVNQELEQRLRRVAAERGLSAEVFLQQVLRDAMDRMLPDPTPGSPRIPGLNTGQIWMSDDFDAPLPDSFWTGEAVDETTA